MSSTISAIVVAVFVGVAVPLIRAQDNPWRPSVGSGLLVMAILIAADSR